MRNQLVIWGASDHARVVADIVQLMGEYELAGFLDDVRPERRGEAFFGSTILGGREQLPRLREAGVRHLIFGFGHGAAKLKLAEVALAAGFEFGKAIHPRATVAASAAVGAGAVIKAGAVLDVDVKIGQHVSVGANVSVAHGSVVGEASLLSGGAALAGRVSVGRCGMIGAGAAVRDGIHIGHNVIIGAGAVVVTDIPDAVVAYGVPARVMRRVDAGGG